MSGGYCHQRQQAVFNVADAIQLPPDPLKVTINHPGYPGRRVILVQLQCLDERVDGEFGFPLDLLEDIAFIVSGNRAGRLLRSSDDPHSAPCTDEIIVPGNYWYFPNDWTNDMPPYPVPNSFMDWQFPKNIPPRWSIFTGRQPPLRLHHSINDVIGRVRERDVVCRITGYQDGSEVAHLVPQNGILDWFRDNNMKDFNQNQGAFPPVTDVHNVLLLRPDLHRFFDTKKAFALVPHGTGARIHFFSSE